MGHGSRSRVHLPRTEEGASASLRGLLHLFHATTIQESSETLWGTFFSDAEARTSLDLLRLHTLARVSFSSIVEK